MTRTSMLMTSFFATVLLLYAPSGAKASEALIFSPSSKWNVDFAEDYCSLRRAFTSAHAEMFLELRQYQPGVGFDIILLNTKHRFRDKRLTFRFAPHLDLIEDKLAFPMATKAEHKGVLGHGRFGPLRPERDYDDPPLKSLPDEVIDPWVSQVTHIEVTRGFGRKLIIETGPFDKAREVMNSCLEDLVTSWGIDAETLKGLTRKPAPRDQKRWARAIQRNYPSEALRKGYVGAVQTRLIVGPDGKPTKCRSVNTFTNEVLDEAACIQLLKHAEFDPALDAEGNAVVGYYFTRINFRLN